MKAFETYTQQVDALVSEIFALSRESMHDQRICVILDGEASQELGRVVPTSRLREEGIFFTGSHLTDLLLQRIENDNIQDAVFYDPACGAGDLLIACARHLPVERSLKRTLEVWNTQLAGHDLHSEFVRITKARLVLAAVSRGAVLDSRIDVLGRESLSPNIRVNNFFQAFDNPIRASHVE
jgi:hypothetical protein